MPAQPTGRSISFVLILIVGLAAAIYFAGWEVLVVAATLAALVTACFYAHDKIIHDRRCPECLAARSELLSSHPDWNVWIERRSHVANLDEEAIVAVFYQNPESPARPAPYRMFAVEYGNGVVTELDRSRSLQYGLRNYKQV